jgi:hypothetical protein
LEIRQTIGPCLTLGGFKNNHMGKPWTVVVCFVAFDSSKETMLALAVTLGFYAGESATDQRFFQQIGIPKKLMAPGPECPIESEGPELIFFYGGSKPLVGFPHPIEVWG